MRATGYTGFVAIALVLTAAAAPAQERSRTEPRSSVYRQLFPRPTGKNGYEELILAGETARASKLYLRAEGALPTDPEGRSLAFKRRVLKDPPVVKALALIRQGLAKSIFPSRRTAGSDTGIQQMRPLHTVRRLLALQQYVLLADGHVSEAILVARQGLRIGQVLYTDPQITGLLGINIATGSLRTLASHLDQLSARDCEQLFQVCVEWLRQPDPQVGEMAEARRFQRTYVMSVREKLTQGGLAALNELQVYDEEIPDEVESALAGSPRVLDELYRQVEQRLDQIYAHNLAQFSKPPWERNWDFPPDDGSPAAQLVALIHSPYEELSDAYTRGSASIQLFACHCAVLRHRWEHHRVPASLTELQLGRLTVDPFTGEPFPYETQGRSYRLTSAGPTADEDDPKAVNGRVPFTIVPGDS